jgi:site-specific DNA-methyltransferase (adenine-specific)
MKHHFERDGVTSTVYLMDCMEFMAGCRDKQFELAIVDPPYGIGFSDYERGSSGIKVKERYTNKGKKKWDESIPNEKYFAELFRISQNQIIWGGNYFPSIWKNGCKGFIFWYKHQPVDNFAKGEFAWTSFDRPAQCFDYMYYGNINRDKAVISPTQKPIALYKWLLHNYAKAGDTILDTHLGSQSSRIAAYEMGFNFVGCELDADYFDQGNKRFENHVKQLKLF